MTIQSKALVRAVAAAAALCLAGAAAQAAEYSFSQTFVNTGVLNNIAGTISGTFEAGTASVAGPNVGLFENLTYLNVSFTGSYTDITTAAVIPVSFSSLGPFQIPTAPGNNVYNDVIGLADAQAGLAVAATSGPLSLSWVAGGANSFLPSEPLAFAQNAGLIFGNLAFFTSAGLVASGDSQRYVNTALAPIPEASTYLMMLAGIAGVAAAVRRRAV